MDKKTKINELKTKLINGVKEYTMDENLYKELLEFQNNFRRYSSRNRILLLLQGAEHYVASYSKWKELGFDVKKGEKSFQILAPIKFKVYLVNEDEEKTYSNLTKEEKKNITIFQTKDKMSFKYVNVFDLGQTTATLDDLPKIYQDLDKDMLVPREIDYETLKTYCESLEYVVKESDSLGATGGRAFIGGSLIEINDSLGDAGKTNVLVHELGHMLMHSKGTEGSKLSSKIKELQAESVAYIVCNYFGLDTGETTFRYLKGWTKELDDKDILDAFDEITKASDKIINGMNDLNKELIRQANEISREAEELVMSSEILYSDDIKENVKQLEQENIVFDMMLNGESSKEEVLRHLIESGINYAPYKRMKLEETYENTYGSPFHSDYSDMKNKLYTSVMETAQLGLAEELELINSIMPKSKGMSM